MRDLHGYKNSLSRKLQHFFGQTFFLKKLNNWFGYLLAICIALGFGYLLATNLVVGLGVFGAILGLFVAIICISSAETGLYIIAGFSFFVSFFSRLLFKGRCRLGPCLTPWFWPLLSGCLQENHLSSRSSASLQKIRWWHLFSLHFF